MLDPRSLFPFLPLNLVLSLHATENSDGDAAKMVSSNTVMVSAGLHPPIHPLTNCDGAPGLGMDLHLPFIYLSQRPCLCTGLDEARQAILVRLLVDGCSGISSGTGNMRHLNVSNECDGQFNITSVSLDKVCRELDPNMLRAFAWLPRYIAISQVWANHSKKAGTYYNLEHFKTRSNQVHIVNYRLDSILGTYSTLAYAWPSSALSLSATTSYR